MDLTISKSYFPSVELQISRVDTAHGDFLSYIHGRDLILLSMRFCRYASGDAWKLCSFPSLWSPLVLALNFVMQVHQGFIIPDTLSASCAMRWATSGYKRRQDLPIPCCWAEFRSAPADGAANR
jgi:hypothetical protein